MKKNNVAIKRIFPFVKQFLGFQDFKGTPRRKKFYDEHEWRYVPLASTLEIHLKKSKKIAESKMKREVFRMPISYNSIEYIFIENSDYIKKLLTVFDKVAKSNRGINRELMISKILTVFQIKKDF